MNKGNSMGSKDGKRSATDGPKMPHKGDFVPI
jgi:hypothetical protein